ncbi:MAG TPA: hypothetical protein VFU11_07245 [Solirubrobacterales bacterium]|nr:hypothetical protein [Solirubrobacterales bacterium]
MEQILAGVVTGLAVLAGALVTSRISARASRVEREERARSELVGALAAFGTAIDRLDVQIAQLPPPPGRVARSMRGATEHLRTLDWLMGRISTATLGRGAMKAVDELIYVSNRLMLLAPATLMPEIQAMNGLIERVELRDEQWRAEWRSSRESLAAASRRVVDPGRSSEE